MAYKILIVEDTKNLAAALQRKLSTAGYVCALANSGEEALILLHQNHYDLMLLDIVMPEVNGFQVLETLYISNIKVPIIVLSNLVQEEQLQDLHKYGVIDFFIKANLQLSSLLVYVDDFFKTIAVKI